MLYFLYLQTLQISIPHNKEPLADLEKLQHALLDFSKRNPNIYFKSSAQFLELNLLELPQDLGLGKKLIIEPNLALSNSINRLRLKANRNSRELGFNALNLISSFVYWHNPHKKNELVCSPLVLHSISITKKKGIEEQYVVKFEAEGVLNPYLVHYWAEIFGFKGQPEKLTKNGIELWLKENEPKLQFVDFKQIDPCNLFDWSIDQSKSVIGNFDFRKMSVIQDYERIKRTPELLEALTNFKSDLSELSVDQKNLYNVLPTDPSQEKVVSAAVNKQNIVVQGPPGTGKSQTLVNLAANLVGKGKKVLIVSEKMAALDVVGDRLKSVGLDDLALFVSNHNSDRRKLMSSLKGNYVQALDFNDDLGAINYLRQKTIDEIDLVKQSISRYFEQLQEKDENGISLQDIYEMKLQECVDNTIKNERVALGLSIGIQEYQKFESQIDQLQKFMEGLGYRPVFGEHPVSHILPEIWNISQAEDKIKQLLSHFESHRNLFNDICKLGWTHLTLSEIQIHCINASFIEKLNQFGLSELAVEGSKASKKYDKLVKRIDRLKSKKKNFHELELNWKKRPLLEDVQSAIRIITDGSKSWITKINPNYQKHLRSVRNGYDFHAHVIKPSPLQVLKRTETFLKNELALSNAQMELTALLDTGQLELIQAIVKDVRIKIKSENQVANIVLEEPEKLQQIIDMSKRYESFYRDCKSLIINASQLKCDEVERLVSNLGGILDELYGWTHHLEKLAKSPSVFQLLRMQKCELSNLKGLVLDDEIRQRLNLRYWLKQNDAFTIKEAFERLVTLQKELRTINAEWIRSRRQQILASIIHSTERSSSKLSRDDKLRKKTLKAAKRILEHEFSKSKRHKSLRELIEGDCLELLLTIKPLWLMSPHTVADNLPLEAIFDVIIFDEASQVRFEESFPSLLRAESCVIVGDEMQLPPSNFFNSRLDTDIAPSLLAHFSSRLKNLKLKWHYRSCHMDLIDFSNKRFYDDQLIIVPDPNHIEGSVELIKVDDGQFIERKNVNEAIALVSRLEDCLNDGIKSIAVVALSIEQMTAIEEVIEHKVSTNPIFSLLYEQAVNYNDDHGHSGLIIKNLENIQGDERDVVIISTGYGPNEKSMVRQHFGPINYEGGEKRLNVLFTRARCRMICVTSLRSSDINGNSDGAKTLHAFLAWLETKSLNDHVVKHQKSKNEFLSGLLSKEQIYATSIDTSKFIFKGEKMVHLLKLKGLNSFAEFDLFGQKNWGTICYDAHTLFHKPTLTQKLVN